MTGGTTGIGFETARGLVLAGASVTIAARNAERGQSAAERLRAEAPAIHVEYLPLDTSSLASVARFAEQVAERLDALDILVNCAGMGGARRREITPDGLNRLLATNYIGHFALTGWLLPLLTRAPEARVVNVSSVSHMLERLNPTHLQSEERFRRIGSYAHTKLLMLLFGLELHRRARTAGLALRSIPVDPGIVRTEIVNLAYGPGSVWARLWNTGARLVGQSPAEGALSLLYAATAPDAQSGAYYGPGGFAGLRGLPAPAWVAPQARDEALASRLWQVSEKVTGVSYL